jgi:hypothetical protein
MTNIFFRGWINQSVWLDLVRRCPIPWGRNKPEYTSVN